MVIYKITNTINEKIYIGQSVDPGQRWCRHKSNARNGTKTPLALAMRKYGIDNFKFEIIDGANSLSELSYKEVHYIHLYNCLAPNGYNLKIKSQQHPFSKKVAPDIIKNSPKFENVIEGLNRGRIKNNENRKIPVKAINEKTGEIIIFDNIRDCGVLGTFWKIIYAMINGRAPYKVRRGWIFEHVNKETIKVPAKRNKSDHKKKTPQELFAQNTNGVV